MEMGNKVYSQSAKEEYYPFFEQPFGALTSKDHIWLKASLEIRYLETFQGTLPCLVMTMERKEGVYGYQAPEIKTDSIKGQWHKFEVTYLTPEIRNPKDRFKCYIWNKGKAFFDFRNLKLEKYEKK